MARAPNDNVNKAFELFKQGLKLVEIASQLKVPQGTVRRWKSVHKWDAERSSPLSERSVETNVNISWMDIEHEYITDIRKKPCTLKELALKYNIDYDYLRQCASKSDWKIKRGQYITKVSQKAIEKSSNKDVERIVRLLEIADIATLKAEQSLSEIETYIVRNKKKVRTIEYNDETAIGKPTKEITHEDETIETVPGPIDRQGLSLITASLKNIKDLYSITNESELHRHKIDYDNERLEIEKSKALVGDNTQTINVIHNIPRPPKDGDG